MREAPGCAAALLIFAGALLAGCAVGPNYHRPQVPVDADFVNASEPGLATGDPTERYWTTFGDPMLTQLVEDCRHSQPGLAGGDGKPAGGACGTAAHGLRSISDRHRERELREGARVRPGIAGLHVQSARVR